MSMNKDRQLQNNVYNLIGEIKDIIEENEISISVSIKENKQ